VLRALLAGTLAIGALPAAPLAAQDSSPDSSPDSSEAEPIADNSFLIEEAYNQEAGVVQHISTFTHARTGRAWAYSFTQEWPAPGMRHQLSYTVPFNALRDGDGIGDSLLNYRLQVLEEGPGRPAFAPRVSLIVPTARIERSSGLQINLPFSKQRNDFYFHWNAGFTWQHRDDRANLVSPNFAGSAIYRAAPMLNVMLESVLVLLETEIAPGVTRQTARNASFTLSPGVRGGWNVTEDKQIIIGAALPITWSEGSSSAGIFGYFSYELPFRK
jgi:hypothetical protein